MGLIKMNGVNYWGSAYGQGIIAPMIYSTEEREVGVWVDGKPLYQITIDQTINSDADYTVIASGIDHAHLVNSKLEWSSGRWMSMDYISLGATSNNRTCYVDVNNGALYFHNQTGQQQRWIATIQYTKTADTAGSGIYTPSGALAVHYSTNEQVIGTWIDGKPLYERTKVVPFANFTHNNDTYFTPIASDNTEILRNVEAIAYSTGYGVCTLGSRAYSRDNTLSYYWELVEYYSNVALHFIGESVTDVGVTEVVITYQYTKTTDV